MNEEDLPLGDQLGEDDWALIIGKDGRLKGMFIPQGKEEEQAPKSLLYIMEHYFGLDLEEKKDDDDDARILH